MQTVLYVLFAIMVAMVFFSIIHIIFTLGRIFENSIVIRELDEKIDREMREIKKINEEIKKLESALKGGD